MRSDPIRNRPSTYSGPVNLGPTTPNATFSASLCDQLWAEGVRAAFIAPGSRSTPLALALVAHSGIDVQLFHDERSAAFAALGRGLATGVPAVVVCSSGTAGAHFYAAVIEADASAVPMIVCTADRPPELWGRGAPQTIDQTNLFGSKVRLFVEPGPPDDGDPQSWRPLARSLYASATGPNPGPVHANLSFRDPLTGVPGELPPPLAPAEPPSAPTVDPDTIDQIVDRIAGKPGVIIAGRSQTDPETIIELTERLQWPLISDHRSGVRHTALALHHFDALLRVPKFADSHQPTVVVRVGEIVASKSTSQWLARCGANGVDVIASRPHGRNIDPEAIAQLQFDEAGVWAAVVAALDAAAAADPEWKARWQAADSAARAAIDPIVNEGGLNEMQVARRVVAEAPEGTALVVSSSMPVRDVEWFAPGNQGLRVFSNRGANGIDGVVATAIGVATTGIPTACLLGDVAFLHDTSSLIALRDRAIDLTIFVTDNDGGGIFSFLPQHELLDPANYEQLFGTPHGTDLATLAAAHGLDYHRWDDLGDGIYTGAGIRVVHAQTNRSVNLALHQSIEPAVAAALDG